MSTQLQIRRDTATDLGTVTPAQAEPIYDQTNKKFGIGDGTSLGNAATLYAVMNRDLHKMAPIYAAAGGTANALTVTLDPVPTAYAAGMTVLVKAAAANTGAATVNVNSLGAKTIKKAGGAEDLEADDIVTGGIYLLLYDGTNFQMISGAGGGGEGAAKAWWNFNGTGTAALRGSYNVASLADNATGIYTITLTDGFSSAANYSVVGNGKKTDNHVNDGEVSHVLTRPITATTIGVYAGSTAGIDDDLAIISGAAFGD